MASILDRYGIKEVADVTFYEITDTGGRGRPVLYLDSLKVSTLEQTAESVYAQGGKGNAKLIGWDFGKEITLTLEDALFSPKSMAIMFGNGTVITDSNEITIEKTISFLAGSNSVAPTEWVDANGSTRTIDSTSVVYYSETGSNTVALSSIESGKRYFATFPLAVNGQQIKIGPNTFPKALKFAS